MFRVLSEKIRRRRSSVTVTALSAANVGVAGNTNSASAGNAR